MEADTTIDHYRLIKPLGAGASSRVFLAVDVRTGQRVSLKVLASNRRPESLARFERAAVLWASLVHDNIVRYIGSGLTPEGDPYLALEFIEGRGLNEIIASDAPMDIDRALRLFRQLAVALRVAHRKGVLHRDIKPSNILVALTPSTSPRYTDRERIKLIDFGLARATERDGRARAGTPAGITGAGFVVGTPRYMAPEQVTPEGACVQSDLYAAALVLYEMITGRPAIVEQEVSEVLYQHLKPEPTVSPEDPALPVALRAVLSRATERRPEDRYDSIEALLAALDGAQLGGAEGAVLGADDTISVDLTTPTELAAPTRASLGVDDTLSNEIAARPLAPQAPGGGKPLARAIPFVPAPEQAAAPARGFPDAPPLRAPARQVVDDLSLWRPGGLPVAGAPLEALPGDGRPASPPGLHQPLPIPETRATRSGAPSVKMEAPPVERVELGVEVSWSGRVIRLFVTLVIGYVAVVGGFWAAQDLLLFRRSTVQIKDERRLKGDMGWEKVQFASSEGRSLVGWFGESTHTERLGTVLYLHGLSSRPEIEAVALDGLRAKGLHVMIFGQQGYGGSEGWSDAESFFNDAPRAYDWIIGDRGAKPFKVFVMGDGAGAAVALHLSRERPVEGIILQGAAPSLSGRLTEVVPIVPFELLLHRDFELSGLSDVRVPVFVLHGREDAVAPLEGAERLYGRIKGPKMMRAVDGAGHDDLPSKLGAGYADAIYGFIAAFSE